MRSTPFLFVAVLMLAAARALAQTPAEITFWESVRDSKNPVELQAYLDQYPNGAYAVLARARLAALGQKPAAPGVATSTATPLVKGEKHIPQAGDTWVYRLSYPRLRGQWGQSRRPEATHAITVSSAADGRVVDALSIDGGTPASSTHDRGPTLLRQGVAIFSPYLFAFASSPVAGRLPTITIIDRGCERGFLCEAKGRISGSETITVPAGKFTATRVVIEQQWRGASVSGQAAGRLNGGRTLTIWYVPEIGRAVKYTSRVTVADFTPMDEPNFDLELVSFQLK